MLSLVILERTSPPIAVLRLNRPEKLNALSSETFEALNHHLDELTHDKDLRALVLTGAGDRAFCAGTDISELTSIEATKLSQRGQRLCDRLENFPVPVIAAINGLAAGGGLELVLACHLRVASTN